MRASSIVCSVLLVCVSLTGCAAQQSSNKSDVSDADKKPQVSDADMMANWTAFMTPGPEHKVLDAAVGKWNTHMKFSAGPTGPTEESDGTSEIEWVMGGRYIHESAHGSAMGQPFEGAGVVGYDKLKKKYVGGWIDNMGTGITASEGTYDAAKKTINFTSAGPDATITKYVPMRMAQTFIDADHFKIDMYSPDVNGKEFKSMELSYSRAK